MNTVGEPPISRVVEESAVQKIPKLEYLVGFSRGGGIMIIDMTMTCSVLPFT